MNKLTSAQRDRVREVRDFCIECCADKPEFVRRFWTLIDELGIKTADVPQEVVVAGRELSGESDAVFADPIKVYLESLLAEVAEDS